MEGRKLVICGDPLGDGRAGHGTYEENGKVYSVYVGLAEEKNGMHFVIPLSGIYNPKKGDGVIGRVEDIIISKWLIDINCPYQAALAINEAVDEFIDLTKSDLTKYFNYGDIIFAEILSVTKTKNVQLSMRERKCRKLKGGRMIKVTPSKVPRIIGRSGSMVEMIKHLTGTQIVVGQNGLVWVKGDNEDIAVEAVLLIEEKSHISGLTDSVKALLERRMKESGVAVQARETHEEQNEAQWGETYE
ncbi:MAG: RNA-binding protein [Candidatus Aenigmarchaeota archaeon]|nr:RNA-binding protein [Candidatus Aenigmarchaeota archaeon]